MPEPMTDAEVADLILDYVSRPLAIPAVLVACLFILVPMLIGEGLGL